ncbi:hypothetical protein ACSLOB_29105, partial [Escherichia coli]
AKTTHHKKQHKAAPAQKAQAAKKHHKNTKAEQKAPEQKAQAAKAAEDRPIAAATTRANTFFIVIPSICFFI